MKQHLTIITAVIALFSMLVGCSKSTSGLKEGGLYYIHNENGTYSVMKLLKVESGGVHVRIYSNEFDAVPTNVDESKLYLAGMNHKDNEILGIADVPLTREGFDNYKATFFQQSTVKPDELTGYNQWKAAGGKYF